MYNDELLEKLIAQAEKFINSQYNCSITVDGASYKNFDLLAVYKINQLYELKRISEAERDYLLDTYHKKVILEEKMDKAQTEKEQNIIEEELTGIFEELFKYGLNLDFSIEYLISNLINNEDVINEIDTELVASIIYISDKLRNEYNLSTLEAANHINFYGKMIPLKENNESIEYFLHKDVRTWAIRIKDRARTLKPNNN